MDEKQKTLVAIVNLLFLNILFVYKILNKTYIKKMLFYSSFFSDKVLHSRSTVCFQVTKRNLKWVLHRNIIPIVFKATNALLFSTILSF